MNVPAGFLAGLAEGGQKELAIAAHDVEAVVASAHDMVNRATIFGSEFAGHARILRRSGGMSIILKS